MKVVVYFVFFNLTSETGYLQTSPFSPCPLFVFFLLYTLSARCSWEFRLQKESSRIFAISLPPVPSTAVGIALPATDFQQWALLSWSCWRFLSQQAGSYKGLQRQSQGTRPQKEAVDTMQLREHCQDPRQYRKKHWAKAMNVPVQGKIFLPTSLSKTNMT